MEAPEKTGFEEIVRMYGVLVLEIPTIVNHQPGKIDRTRGSNDFQGDSMVDRNCHYGLYRPGIGEKPIMTIAE
jgi:hypothetical protein